MSTSKDRATMPKNTVSILENRNLREDYPTIAPLISKGMRVLDAGCGTGAITKGIAELVGEEGYVVGIDSSESLINEGKVLNNHLKNLELINIDLFEYKSEIKFDLIVSARVLQWLENPKEALSHMKSLLKIGGTVSILDYNHTALEWFPEPPKSMRRFYQTFLKWRSDAGMNNAISETLPAYFKELGFDSIETIEANEIYSKGEPKFLSKIGIWTKVAQSRGNQLVKDGYLEESDRLNVIEEYSNWIEAESECMIMKLKEIRGVKHK